MFLKLDRLAPDRCEQGIPGKLGGLTEVSEQNDASISCRFVICRFTGLPITSQRIFTEL